MTQSTNVTAFVSKTAPLLASNIDGLTSGALFDHPNGCSQYLCGEGVIHTRSVNVASNVFMRESSCREVRKALLLRDLALIRGAVVNLQAELLKHQENSGEEADQDRQLMDVEAYEEEEEEEEELKKIELKYL